MAVDAQRITLPGAIYKEFAINLYTGNNWRVTEPESPQAGAQEFLPNPILNLTIDDLEGAIRAEALIDVWGGHIGTTGKKIRFNENDWIDIPEISGLSSPECYMTQYNVIVDLPLEYLVEGVNTFQGTSGPQTCYGFNWGQWGWWVMMVRIYYGPDKAHTGGSILYPESGSVINDYADIKISVDQPERVSQVQVLGKYYGYDENGDGKYHDWHRAYHSVNIEEHIGSITESPFSLSWNTEYIPDQKPGDISLMARIKDTSGVWYVSEIAEQITLERNSSYSVSLYPAVNVPQKYWVRAGAEASSDVEISELTNAISANLLHRTWNGSETQAAGGSYHRPLTVNKGKYKVHGNSHNFANSSVEIAVGDLLIGTNAIKYVSDTEHHGIEILWPGPAILVRYLEGAEKLNTPEYDPPSCNFSDPLEVRIETADNEARTYYTRDGNIPNKSYALYLGGDIKITKTTTIKSRSFKDDFIESDIGEANYILFTGLENKDSINEIVIYPNPACSIINLILPSSIIVNSFSIISEAGKLVYNNLAPGNTISLSGIDPGIYTIVMKVDTEVISKILIIR